MATADIGQWLKKTAYSLVDVENAAPGNINSVFVAYVPIHTKVVENGKDVKQFAGVFIPELYQLAKAGALRVQKEAKKKKVLLTKSAFELAVFHPTHPHQSEEGFAEIALHIAKEFRYRRDHGLALPRFVSKLRVKDYIQTDKKAGVYVIEGANEVRINIPNPSKKALKRHKMLHFVGSWVATALTWMSVAAALFGTGSWAVCGAVAVGTWITKKCLFDFAWYDNAEEFHRLIGLGFAKDLPFKGSAKLSWTRLAFTLVQLAAIGMAVYGAALGGMELAMSLPWAGFTSAISGAFPQAAASITTAAQWGLGVFAASAYGIGMAAGLSVVVSYIQNITPFDLQAHPTKDEMNELLTSGDMKRLRKDKVYDIKNNVVALPKAERKQLFAELNKEFGASLVEKDRKKPVTPARAAHGAAERAARNAARKPAAKPAALKHAEAPHYKTRAVAARKRK